MTKKKYPTSAKEWMKYLTVDQYLTPKEIEYRKKLIIESECNYNEVNNKIIKYRNRFKKELISLENESFTFVETHYMKENVDKIKNFWKNSSYSFKESYKKELIFDTLLSEAFHSSSIEGAHSTKKRTEEIIKKQLTPVDKSERMIFNNYKALEYIFDNKEQKLDDTFVLSLHKMISEDTLDEKEDEGAYRNDGVDITTATQKVVFRPTSNIEKMMKMINKLYLFTNSNNDDCETEYIESIYKIIAFHFLYGYIHPHFDGNGRTLRVLFTHLLGQNGFDMFYYISLSEIIHLSEKRKKEYEKAFIDVEENELDLTYFIYYIQDIMIEALQVLDDRVFLYFRESIIFDKVEEEDVKLTKRQENILKLIAKNKRAFAMTSKEIAKRFKLSTQTILRDIRFLIDFKLLRKKQTGLKIYYELDIDVTRS
ncbi:MAG: Fic family protein [Campylobacterota bacterium]|nr:Fic family protein [Campylobacterota bacterium]